MPVSETEDSDLIFYTNPQSRGQIVRWMLEEVGISYQQVILEYGGSMKGEDYLKVNPMGKVPAIKHKNQVVTECAAICAYLADAFPDADLAPPLSERAEYYRWLFFASGPLEAAITDRNLQIDVTAEQERMVGYGNYNKVLDVLSHRLLDSEYIAGDQFTAADVYVGSHVSWGLLFGTMELRPGFKEYADRLMKRDAFKAAKAIDTALM